MLLSVNLSQCQGGLLESIQVRFAFEEVRQALPGEGICRVYGYSLAICILTVWQLAQVEEANSGKNMGVIVGCVESEHLLRVGEGLCEVFFGDGVARSLETALYLS